MLPKCQNRLNQAMSGRRSRRFDSMRRSAPPRRFRGEKLRCRSSFTKPPLPKLGRARGYSENFREQTARPTSIMIASRQAETLNKCGTWSEERRKGEMRGVLNVMVKCKNLTGKWGAGQARCEIPTKQAGFSQSCGPALIGDRPSRPDQSTTT
jgi:hypothetical protein